MPFNDQPRPKYLIQQGPLSVELGDAQRKCRGCLRPITKGTYHLAINLSDSGSTLKVCESCLMNSAQWCKLANRRNL